MTAVKPPIHERARVGFASCSDGRGRIIRLALHGPGRGPRRVVIDCPHCHTRHEISPSWRSPTDYDAGREPEVIVAAEGGKVRPWV